MRYEEALERDEDERATVIEKQLSRLERQSREQASAVATAESRLEKERAAPDLAAASEWLHDVLGQISGQLEAAEDTEALCAALRAAIETIYVQVRGNELEIDIRARAPEMPDILIWTDADDPLFRNVLENTAPLGGSPFSTVVVRQGARCRCRRWPARRSRRLRSSVTTPRARRSRPRRQSDEVSIHTAAFPPKGAVSITCCLWRGCA